MQQGLGTSRRWLAVISLSCGNCVASVDASILNVALPTIAQDLHVPQSASVMLVSVYQLVLLMTLLPFAALGEKVGLTRLYQIGQALFALAALGCIFAPNLPLLVVARAVQSVGAAAIMAVSPAIVRIVYPPEKLGSGLALNAFTVTMATTIAPTLGGLVLAFGQWRWIFAVALPLIVGSLLFGRALPEAETHDEPYDFRAAGMSAVTFLLLVGGLEIAIHGTTPLLWIAPLLAGALMAALFVRRERRSARPVLPIDLMAQPAITLSIIGGLCVYLGTQGVMLSLPFRFQHSFGYSPAETGALLAAWPFALVLAVPVSGYLSDRVSAGVLGAIGMAICFVGLLSLTFLPADPSYFDIAWRLWLSGAGFGIFVAPNNRLVIGSAPRNRMAAAAGLNATTRLTGQTLGATLSALLLAVGAGLGRAPTLIASALVVVALGCSLYRLRPVNREPTTEEVDSIATPTGG